MTQLIDHNEDLSKLKKEGYDISIVKNNIVVKGIPYVNKNKKILFATLYCPLDLSGQKTLPPKNHTARFTGEHPCDQFGKPDKSFVNSENKNELTSEIVGRYYLSSKPQSGKYPDFYSKIKRYIELLSAPAKSIEPSIKAKKFDHKAYTEKSVFKYPDTNTARAEITNISKKLENQKIAIIGLGGTGSFVLDFVSKTPVKQISLFDGDDMLNHNAFRIPGAMSAEELEERSTKVSYLKNKYEKLREGIIAHNEYINESNLTLLDDHDFVFLTIDEPGAKKIIIEYLLDCNIPFVDLGIGINVAQNSIRGTIRKTLITPDNSEHLNKIAMNQKADDDIYAQNIQISELNALNAILGIISWKKLNGFYLTDEIYYNSTFVIDEEEIFSET